MDSRPHDHDFGGLHQRIGFDAALESKVLARLAGDDRGNHLSANVELHLGEQPIMTNAFNGAQKFVSSADCLQHARTALPFRRLYQCQPVDFRLRDAMVTSGSADGLNSSLVNPLLECGIADIQQFRGFRELQQRHGPDYTFF